MQVTTQKFNKLTSGNFEAKLKQVYLETKGDIADLIGQTSFHNKRINLNKKLVQINQKK